MDSYKGPKRLFEFQKESRASAPQEASQNETDRVEGKRQRTAIESTGDDFEEFVALLDRIQYMKSRDMKSRIDKVIKSKSPYTPSFDWEDFSPPAADDSIAAQRDICSLSAEKDRSSCEKNGNDRPKTCPSSDPYGKCATESFDLNLEPS